MNETEIRQAILSYRQRSGASHSRLRAALVDMDGVLYDSMPRHTRAWHRMMSAQGIDCTREEFFLYEGMTGIATINLLFQRQFGKTLTDDEARRLYAIKSGYFNEQGLPPLMPGTADMLNVLKRNGLRCVLVTGSAQASVMERIDKDYPATFSAADRVTAHDVVHGKPNPEPYLRGLAKAGVGAPEAIVVENAPLGVEAGVKAGCFTVAVTTGPIPRENFVGAGADLIFPSMPEFASSLQTIIDIFNESL